jgi:hypothetical protein
MCEPVPDDEIDPVPAADTGNGEPPAEVQSDTGNGEPPPN